MREFFLAYGLFLAKTVTVVLGILAVVVVGVLLRRMSGAKPEGSLRIRYLNSRLHHMAHHLRMNVLTKNEWKAIAQKEKEREAADKLAAKDATSETHKKRLFVLQFDGDLRAHAVDALREEVTAVLAVATPIDEVVVCVESPGGVVHGYGLAASQLVRVKERHIPLTVCIDKVAASGGYLMAAVADKIVAAPFAIVGSIGVVAEMPNFYHWLKDRNIHYEQITAGTYKRTMSMFAETSSRGRAKMQDELEEVHHTFKDFLRTHRPHLDVEHVATGEHWLAAKALTLGLVDALSTSDAYMTAAAETADVFEVTYEPKESLSERFGVGLRAVLGGVYGWVEDRLAQR